MPARKPFSTNAPKFIPLPPPPNAPSLLSLQPGFSSSHLRLRFRKLFSPSLILSWLQDCPGSFRNRLFTPPIVLWYLLYQHLFHSSTLAAVISNARSGGGDFLCSPLKPLSLGLKSNATASYSNARQSFPLLLLLRSLEHAAKQIRSWISDPTWKGWNTFLLDGSTVRLRSINSIPKDFPPQKNSRGHSYWCPMRVVVAFCMKTGVAASTAMDACSQSEQALSRPLLPNLGPKSLIVADRNFGVFSIVQAAADASAQLVVRLTHARAAKLAKDNGFLLTDIQDQPVQWTASRNDKSNSKSPNPSVQGRLLVLHIRRPGHGVLTLYLFTTLLDTKLYTASDVLELYGKRWQVELNLRFVKSQMGLGMLECRSAEMAKKEWVAGLLAYNLIRSLMGVAAATQEISIWDLSFTQTRAFLMEWVKCQQKPVLRGQKGWERLVEMVAECRQPKRRKPRPAEPRAQRHAWHKFKPLRGSRAAARAKLHAKVQGLS